MLLSIILLLLLLTSLHVKLLFLSLHIFYLICCIFLNIFFHVLAGMLPAFLLAGLILALSIPGTTSESATLRFLGQTDFVVNESSAAVVRLVIERVGDPVNVTALVLVGYEAII